MNLFGLLLGVAVLFIIGFGFVWVIRVEYLLGYYWWPYVMGLGIIIVAISIFVPNIWAAAVIGAFGASFVWGATELKEQAVRSELGWYPFNPKPNPNPPFIRLIKKLPIPHL